MSQNISCIQVQGKYRGCDSTHVQCTVTVSSVGGDGAPLDPPQEGRLVLFVYGETTRQANGCGGIGGGGKFVETGWSRVAVAALKTLFVIVTGSHPPPSNLLLGLPHVSTALAMLFVTCTVPQG